MQRSRLPPDSELRPGLSHGRGRGGLPIGRRGRPGPAQRHHPVVSGRHLPAGRVLRSGLGGWAGGGGGRSGPLEWKRWGQKGGGVAPSAAAHNTYDEYQVRGGAMARALDPD